MGKSTKKSACNVIFYLSMNLEGKKIGQGTRDGWENLFKRTGWGRVPWVCGIWVKAWSWRGTVSAEVCLWLQYTPGGKNKCKCLGVKTCQRLEHWEWEGKKYLLPRGKSVKGARGEGTEQWGERRGRWGRQLTGQREGWSACWVGGGGAAGGFWAQGWYSRLRFYQTLSGCHVKSGL